MSFACPFMVVCHDFCISSEAIVPRGEGESERRPPIGSQGIVFLSGCPVAGKHARVV